MINVLVPVEWVWTISGKVPIRYAGWVNLGTASGGVQWIEAVVIGY